MKDTEIIEGWLAKKKELADKLEKLSLEERKQAIDKSVNKKLVGDELAKKAGLCDEECEYLRVAVNLWISAGPDQSELFKLIDDTFNETATDSEKEQMARIRNEFTAIAAGRPIKKGKEIYDRNGVLISRATRRRLRIHI